MTRLNLLFGIAGAAALGFGGFYFFQNTIMADRTAPELICSEDTISCTIDATDADLCAGLSASDNRDGDITDQIMVNEIKVKNNTADTEGDASIQGKEFNISYLVFDDASNMATCSRILIYTDYVTPRFDISAPLQFTSFSDANQNIQTYLTATDCIEGDLTSQITLELSDEYLQYAGDGSYDCSASVTNSYGITSTIPLIIDVTPDDADSSVKRPDLSLTQYILYIKQGDSFDPEDYLSSIKISNVTYELRDGSEADYTVYDADLDNSDASDLIVPYSYGYYDRNRTFFMFKSEITIDDEVDTDTPGGYIVSYAYTNPDSKMVGTANLVVMVE